MCWKVMIEVSIGPAFTQLCLSLCLELMIVKSSYGEWMKLRYCKWFEVLTDKSLSVFKVRQKNWGLIIAHGPKICNAVILINILKLHQIKLGYCTNQVFNSSPITFHNLSIKLHTTINCIFLPFLLSFFLNYSSSSIGRSILFVS